MGFSEAFQVNPRKILISSKFDLIDRQLKGINEFNELLNC